jgi:hypothetical protein
LPATLMPFLQTLIIWIHNMLDSNAFHAM